MASLFIRREEGETWADCALRYGRKYGLEQEVAMTYAAAVESGDSEEDAALHACSEWDLCEYRP